MTQEERIKYVQTHLKEAINNVKADHAITTPDGTFSIDTEVGLILFERNNFKYIVNYPKEWSIDQLFSNLAYIIYPEKNTTDEMP